jgi:hypothetical protein
MHAHAFFFLTNMNSEKERRNLAVTLFRSTSESSFEELNNKQALHGCVVLSEKDLHVLCIYAEVRKRLRCGNIISG